MITLNQIKKIKNELLFNNANSLSKLIKKLQPSKIHLVLFNIPLFAVSTFFVNKISLNFFDINLINIFTNFNIHSPALIWIAICLLLGVYAASFHINKYIQSKINNHLGFKKIESFLNIEDNNFYNMKHLKKIIYNFDKSDESTRYVTKLLVKTKTKNISNGTLVAILLNEYLKDTDTKKIVADKKLIIEISKEFLTSEEQCVVFKKLEEKVQYLADNNPDTLLKNIEKIEEKSSLKINENKNLVIKNI